jgi:hypothetical protein
VSFSTALAGRYRCRPKRGVGATFESLAALRGKIGPDLARPEERGFLLAIRNSNPPQRVPEPAATPRPRLTARKDANLPFLRIISQEVNVPTDYYATGYLERDTKPHSGSSYKRIKDGLLQELVNYVMERSSDQRGLYRITVGENVYTGLEIEKLYDQSDFPRG